MGYTIFAGEKPFFVMKLDYFNYLQDNSQSSTIKKRRLLKIL
jgi:hypothetical protein